MSNRTVVAALLVAVLGLAFVTSARAEGTKVTITGVARALTDPTTKMDPAVANATVTVTAGTVQTVYYVYGWGGVVCAKHTGKTVEVTGVLRQTSSGRKALTAASVDVRVISAP
jgi:hypothetical protein